MMATDAPETAATMVVGKGSVCGSGEGDEVDGSGVPYPTGVYNSIVRNRIHFSKTNCAFYASHCIKQVANDGNTCITAGCRHRCANRPTVTRWIINVSCGLFKKVNLLERVHASCRTSRCGETIRGGSAPTLQLSIAGVYI
jgi:hypothetical protein